MRALCRGREKLMLRETLLPQAATSVNANTGVQNTVWPLVVFLLAHVFLALAMRESRLLATAHALITVLVGFWWVLAARYDPIRVINVIGYIVGAEVLWRMTRAGVFWEYGKYTIVLLCLLGLLRKRERIPLMPIVYFVLLIPSILLTANNLSIVNMRDALSFNLSGAFTLMACACFCSGLAINRQQLLKLCLATIGPLVGIATITFVGTYTAHNISFINDSNFATSGGYGPNQVSSLLGLGALLAFYYVINDRSGPGRRWVILGVLLLCAAQSMMTFSRGGIYGFIGAILVAIPFLVRDTWLRWRVVSVAAVAVILGWLILIPYLDTFTGGALGKRYLDTNTTNRVEIAVGDWQIWQKHFLLGVGPGGSSYLHFSYAVAAHTELSRMLAEHGLFGFFALLLMIGMSMANLVRARTPVSRALAASFAVWALLYMLNAAMRTAAVSFIFALPFARLLCNEEAANGTAA